MSRKLLLGVIAGIVLIGALIGAVRAVSAAWPSPIHLIFTDVEGQSCAQPCLFGIQPGQTTPEQALDIAQNHPALRNLDIYTPRDGHRGGVWRPQQEGFLVAGRQISLVVYFDYFGGQLRVSSADLQFGRDAYRSIGQPPGALAASSLLTEVRLGEIVLALGRPHSILLYKGRNSLFSVTSYHANALMLGSAHLSPSHIDSNDPVGTIALSASRGSWQPNGTPWLGFAHYVRYFSLVSRPASRPRR
jgi:hypothetical protein